MTLRLLGWTFGNTPKSPYEFCKRKVVIGGISGFDTSIKFLDDLAVCSSQPSYTLSNVYDAIKDAFITEVERKYPKQNDTQAVELAVISDSYANSNKLNTGHSIQVNRIADKEELIALFTSLIDHIKNKQASKIIETTESIFKKTKVMDEQCNVFCTSRLAKIARQALHKLFLAMSFDSDKNILGDLCRSKSTSVSAFVGLVRHYRDDWEQLCSINNKQRSP